MVSIKLYIQELQRNVAKKHLWNNFSDTDVDIKKWIYLLIKNNYC